MGVSQGNIDQVESEYRRRDGLRLEAQIDADDITVRRDMMFNHERSLDLDSEGDTPGGKDEQRG